MTIKIENFKNPKWSSTPSSKIENDISTVD